MEWLWVVALLAIILGPLVVGLFRAARHPEMGRRSEADESEELRTIRGIEDLRRERERRWR